MNNFAKWDRITYEIPRPHINFDIKYRVSLKLVQQNPELCFAENEEDAAECLAKMAHDYSNDGYEFARNLEDIYGWDVGADIVKILDQYDAELEKFLIKLQYTWAETNNIFPPVPLGTTIQFVYGNRLVFGKTKNISNRIPASYEVEFVKERYGKVFDDIVTIYYEECFFLNY